MSQICLPENYADKMFELEAALQYEITIEGIRDLNDHYRAGIDYFVEKDQRKATHLQKKMTGLLANPDNIRVLQRQSKKIISTQLPKQNSQNVCQVRKSNQAPTLNTRKLKQQITKFHTVADTCIQNIVQNSNKMADKVQRLKRKDLNKQQEQLNDRILLKRVRSQQKINFSKLGQKSQNLINTVQDKSSTASQNVDMLKKFIE